MEIAIRQANKNDYDEIENLTREAFWNVYKPGCDEHLVVHNMHDKDLSIKDLELVAVSDNKIVGHIMYSRVNIPEYEDKKLICFGPLSVEPNYHHQGIGSKLVITSLKKAEKLGYEAVFITGKPEFYGRFGFEMASKYGIHMDGIPIEMDAPFFMVKQFKNSVLNKNEGILYFDPCFFVDKDELEIFDKKFPYKEKKVMEGQL